VTYPQRKKLNCELPTSNGKKNKAHKKVWGGGCLAQFTIVPEKNPEEGRPNRPKCRKKLPRELRARTQ